MGRRYGLRFFGQDAVQVDVSIICDQAGVDAYGPSSSCLGMAAPGRKIAARAPSLSLRIIQFATARRPTLLLSKRTFPALENKSEHTSPGQQQRGRFRRGRERKRCVERTLTRNVGPDAQPVGIEI